MKKAKRLVPLLVLALAGCCLDTKALEQVRDAIAPEYLAYVNADASKTQDEKDRRARTVQAWDVWIQEAKK
jgi:nicotinamidase-related amidase